MKVDHPPARDSRAGDAEARASSKRLHWRGKLGLFLVSVLAQLLLAEAVFRAFGLFEPEPRYFVGERKNEPSENFVADAHTGWRMRPDHAARDESDDGSMVYHSNAQGFRSPVDFGPRTDARRIVVLGDSHSWGLGVEYEETFGARIEQGLNRTEVYNLSMPGYGVDQMYQALRYQALPYQPDLVIVGLFAADFRRSQTAYRVNEGFNKPLFQVTEDGLVLREPGDRPSWFVRAMERHSHLWQAGRLAWRWLGFRFPVGEFWHLNRAILDAMQAECEKAGVDLVFLYIPYRTFQPFHTLRSYFEETGAQFVDLTDDPPVDRPGLFRGDGHLSVGGHGYTARRLLTWLRDFYGESHRAGG